MVILLNGMCLSIACSCMWRDARRRATSHFKSDENLSFITSWQHYNMDNHSLFMWAGNCGCTFIHGWMIRHLTGCRDSLKYRSVAASWVHSSMILGSNPGHDRARAAILNWLYQPYHQKHLENMWDSQACNREHRRKAQIILPSGLPIDR